MGGSGRQNSYKGLKQFNSAAQRDCAALREAF